MLITKVYLTEPLTKPQKKPAESTCALNILVLRRHSDKILFINQLDLTCFHFITKKKKQIRTIRWFETRYTYILLYFLYVPVMAIRLSENLLRSKNPPEKPSDLPRSPLCISPFVPPILR